MSIHAALALVCLSLCALWPLIALTNYVATTWRYGLNERARIRRQRAEDLRRSEELASLIREKAARKVVQWRPRNKHRGAT